MSAPKSVRATMSSVSRIISAAMSNDPLFAGSFAHAESISFVAATIVPTSAATRLGWNAGCASFRWRRHSSPSLVSNPSPSRARRRLVPRPLV
jgi:hypothetical protein